MYRSENIIYVGRKTSEKFPRAFFTGTEIPGKSRRFYIQHYFILYIFFRPTGLRTRNNTIYVDIIAPGINIFLSRGAKRIFHPGVFFEDWIFARAKWIIEYDRKDYALNI